MIADAREKSIRMEGEKGFKMLRKLQKVGDRNMIIIMVKGLKSWLKVDGSSAIRKRDEANGNLQIYSVIRNIEQIAVESNEIIKHQIGFIKVSLQ
jgi:hypothetical protein